MKISKGKPRDKSFLLKRYLSQDTLAELGFPIQRQTPTLGLAFLRSLVMASPTLSVV
jgi:hypothetical protein